MKAPPAVEVPAELADRKEEGCLLSRGEVIKILTEAGQPGVRRQGCSTTTVAGSSSYRCFSGSGIYDPCFAKPGATSGPVICPTNPAGANVVQLNTGSYRHLWPEPHSRGPGPSSLPTAKSASWSTPHGEGSDRSGASRHLPGRSLTATFPLEANRGGPLIARHNSAPAALSLSTGSLPLGYERSSNQYVASLSVAA